MNDIYISIIHIYLPLLYIHIRTCLSYFSKQYELSDKFSTYYNTCMIILTIYITLICHCISDTVPSAVKNFVFGSIFFFCTNGSFIVL